ncbi:hypothetical protein J6590_102061 [Homalodisca vitripennis]|nr:hypothetical protein J6590_023351 [Homalodisca vitripennis]KAG8299396.1 hypothetical protein J6590_102061 [Homalodisca vitripennis]
MKVTRMNELTSDERISSATPVSGMCKPGARLLDFVCTGPTPPEFHSAELVLAILPHHHDLRSNHPIHEETVLVNAFIGELAARYNTRLLKFDEIGRRSFTRHGQHLSMKGKRLLAGMIVECLAAPGPVRPAQPPRHVSAPAVATSPATVPAPAAAAGGTTAREQHITYAEAVSRSPGRKWEMGKLKQ